MHEYDDEADSEGAELTRYVEAISRVNFSVDFRTDKRFTWRYNDVEMRISFDGGHAEGQVFYANHKKGGVAPKTISRRSECQNSLGFSRKFAFAELNTNDGQPTLELKKKLANIGEVTVKMYRIRMIAEIPMGDFTFEEAVGAAGVPEKALMDRAVPTAEHTALARICRSKASSRGVRRQCRWRSGTPDTLSAEEARELMRIQWQKLQDRAKIKKEKRKREEDDDADGDDEFTMIGEQRKRQTLSTGSGIKVIDLSSEYNEERRLEIAETRR